MTMASGCRSATASRLGQRQPRARSRGGFARQGGLVDPGARHLERRSPGAPAASGGSGKWRRGSAAARWTGYSRVTELAYEKQRLSRQIGFDLAGVDTYHTRPMSEPWSQLSDVDRLGRQASRRRLRDPAGSVAESARANRGRQAARSAASRISVAKPASAWPSSRCEGEALLVCQRCLEPMQWPVRARRASR